jgi:hypothetical protein
MRACAKQPKQRKGRKTDKPFHMKHPSRRKMSGSHEKTLVHLKRRTDSAAHVGPRDPISRKGANA